MGMNKELKLPYNSGMKKYIIAFDVDGTLITNKSIPATENSLHVNKDYPNPRIVELLKTLSSFKNIKIVVWSGGGKDYAQGWVDRLDIAKYVWRVASKTEHKDINADIAIDDIQDTAIGLINLIVREK